MVIEYVYSIYMYKPLLVNISVSVIVSGVQPHMTSPHKEKTENQIFWKILVLCPQNRNMPWKSKVKYIDYTKCSLCPVESIKVGSEANGVSESGIKLRTSS